MGPKQRFWLGCIKMVKIQQELSCPLKEIFCFLSNEVLWYQTMLILGQLEPVEHVSNIFVIIYDIPRSLGALF